MTITSFPTTGPAPSASKASVAQHTDGDGTDPTAGGTALGFLAELAAAITSVGNLAQVTGTLPGTVAGSESSSTPAVGAATTGSAATATPMTTVAGQAVALGLPRSLPLVGASGASTSPVIPGLTTQQGKAASSAAAGSPTVTTSSRTTAVPAGTAIPASQAPVDAPPVTTPATLDQPAPTPLAHRTAAKTALPTDRAIDPVADAVPALPDQATAPDVTQTAVQTTTVTGTAAPAQAAAATGSAASGDRTTAVLQQVFPEVTKLATAGNGTHRMTLTLHPEDLGTVRVTLTVHDGAVRVSLAADQARSALLDGSSELHRILEQTGATDTRITVRDLAGGASTTTGGFDRQPGQQGQQGQAGQQQAYDATTYGDQSRRPRQSAPTEPSTAATTTTAPEARPATQSPTRRAAAGLDQLI